MNKQVLTIRHDITRDQRHNSQSLLSSNTATKNSFRFCSWLYRMAFRCGQNNHIIKYEMENTNILPKGVNESSCINTKSRILKSLSK